MSAFKGDYYKFIFKVIPSHCLTEQQCTEERNPAQMVWCGGWKADLRKECDDVNINYLAKDCNNRQQLDNLLATYNLISTTRLPTRLINRTVSATDNIFIDILHIGKYAVCPINGLSDHDTQIIRIQNIFTQKN